MSTRQQLIEEATTAARAGRFQEASELFYQALEPAPTPVDTHRRIMSELGCKLQLIKAAPGVCQPRH